MCAEFILKLPTLASTPLTNPSSNTLRRTKQGRHQNAARRRTLQMWALVVATGAAIFVCATASSASSSYAVSALDNSVVVGIDADTGFIVTVGVGKGGPFDALGGGALHGCSIVPNTTSVQKLQPAFGVKVTRTFACSDGFTVSQAESFAPAANGVAWNATYSVGSAPGCVAARCQECVPGNTSAGNCCGTMSCLFDPVFRKNICVPDTPWICDATPSGPGERGPERVTGDPYPGVFTTPITTSLQLSGQCASDGLQYWTAWGMGNVANNNGPATWTPTTLGAWENPLRLAPVPASSPALYRLGAQSASLPGGQADSMTIPVGVLASPACNVTVALALSPRDPLLDVGLSVGNATGVGPGASLQFSRYLLRQTGGGPDVTVAAMIYGAQGVCFRPALAALVESYPEYFLPHPESNATQYAGLGSYSWNLQPYNATRSASLGFTTNWDLSGTFMPYDGLFLPYQSEWQNLGPINAGLDQYNVTFALIDSTYAGIQAAGFHSLSYFDIGNWGVSVKLPTTDNTTCGTTPYGASAPCPTVAGSSAYLQSYLSNALLTQAWSLGGGFINQSHGVPDWVGTVLMDPSDEALQALLVDQAYRHVVMVPHFEGIAVDRLDYTEWFNLNGDDGVSWCPQSSSGDYGPAQSLRLSYRAVWDIIGPALHGARNSKNVTAAMFMNCNTLCRIDQLQHFDGLFSEGSALNAVAWASLRKPSILWTYGLSGMSSTDLDLYFGQHLLMHVFPMAPMPLNDHSIQPGNATVDSFYQDHAPLFNAVRQCSWALTAQAATASPNLSFAANALECPSGDEVFVPVLATGGGTGTATVAVRHLPPCTAPASLAVDVLDPGATQWRPIATQPAPTLDLTVDVQVTRSCALLRVTCVGGSA